MNSTAATKYSEVRKFRAVYIDRVMVDVHRYHEISEANHHILNPLSADQLLLVGDICEPRAGQRHLDLASGKGEMLCQFALRYGTTGIGVDVYPGCIDAATARAIELGVDHAVEFVHDDASTFAATPNSFDLGSCIGASWIGGGLPDTLRLMRSPVRRDGWLLVGELFWNEQPPAAVKEALGYGDEVVDLAGTLARFDDAGLDLVEMVLATQETWDRYAASQWLNVARWLDEHPNDPEADDVRRTRDASRRKYLEYERQYLGWGVFILRLLAEC
jgi:hypothetical protein